LPISAPSIGLDTFNPSRFFIGSRTQWRPRWRAGRGRRPNRMRTSTERILTTHVGSLPRSGEVVELLYKKDGGEPYDHAAFDAAVATAVANAVAKRSEERRVGKEGSYEW